LEPGALKIVVLQQLEQDDMVSDNRLVQRPAAEHEPRKDPTPVSPPSGPPIRNEGLESLRSSHC
jgi:hypothetical protein